MLRLGVEFMSQQLPLTTPTWHTLGTTRCALGESPFWHPTEQMLYWVDISGKQLLRANVYMGSVQHWDMPSEPGCMAPATAGGLIIALRDGVFRARQWGGTLEPLLTLPYDAATVRANDGKCDALGRFWVGTVDETRTQQAGALYAIDGRGGQLVVEKMRDQALTANGLAWSPNADTVYWVDTPRHQVHAWHYDLQRNTMQGQRIHVQLPAKPVGWTRADSHYQGRPDGAAVDVQGNYWVAMYEGRRVCKYAPDGSLLEQLETPVQCPTMPCFGGEDFKTLYLTSARHGRSDDELATYAQSGAVFFTRVATPGLPVNFYSG